jgi:hypothetical protein
MSPSAQPEGFGPALGDRRGASRETPPAPSGDEFWELIRRYANLRPDERAKALQSALMELQPDVIREYDAWFHDRHGELHDDAIWAAAGSAMGMEDGYLSDDGFAAWRYWAVSNGQDFYEAVRASPATALAARQVGLDGWFGDWEALGFVAYHAYGQLTGRDLWVEGEAYEAHEGKDPALDSR